MTKPRPGLMACHNGTPVEFLHLVSKSPAGEVWTVRPIFVETQDRQQQLVAPGDRVTPIHSTVR